MLAVFSRSIVCESNMKKYWGETQRLRKPCAFALVRSSDDVRASEIDEPLI